MTIQKNSQGLLRRKSNNRWKWMAGATAASAAAATASQADTTTVNLVNNYISAHGGNHLTADLTGDGHPDLTIANAYAFFSTRTIGTSTVFTNARAEVNLNGVYAVAFHYGDGYPIGVILGSQHRTVRYCNGHTSTCGSYLTGSIPIFFKDLSINGGAPTKGFLEVTVSVTGDPEVQLDSFTYNTADPRPSLALPYEGSSLALLAMGASGVLALRRRRAAQGRS
jgi:hypothetical protein